MNDTYIYMAMEKDIEAKEEYLKNMGRKIKTISDIYIKSFAKKAQSLAKDPIFSIPESKERVIQNYENSKNTLLKIFENYLQSFMEMRKWIKEKDEEFQVIASLENDSIKNLYQRVVKMEQTINELESEMVNSKNILECTILI